MIQDCSDMGGTCPAALLCQNSPISANIGLIFVQLASCSICLLCMQVQYSKV